MDSPRAEGSLQYRQRMRGCKTDNVNSSVEEQASHASTTSLPILSLEAPALADSATALQELLRSAKAKMNSPALFPNFLAQCAYDGCILWHMEVCLHLTPEMVGAGGRRLHYQRPTKSNEARNQESGISCSVCNFKQNLVCCRKT